VARSPSFVGRGVRDSSQQSRRPTVEAGPSPFRRARAAPAAANRREQHRHGRAALAARSARPGGDRTQTPTTPRRALFRAAGRRASLGRCTVGGCRWSRSCCKRHTAGCQPARAQDRDSPRHLRRQRRSPSGQCGTRSNAATDGRPEPCGSARTRARRKSATFSAASRTIPIARLVGTRPVRGRCLEWTVGCRSGPRPPPPSGTGSALRALRARSGRSSMPPGSSAVPAGPGPAGSSSTDRADYRSSNMSWSMYCLPGNARPFHLTCEYRLMTTPRTQLSVTSAVVGAALPYPFHFIPSASTLGARSPDVVADPHAE
jgi:hypothetical protein